VLWREDGPLMFAPFNEIEEAVGPVIPVPVPAPAEIIGGIEGVIGDAAAKLDDDDFAMLMAVATTDGNAKVAFVMNTASGWQPVIWFERKDGQNVGGIGVVKTWKRDER
jgi:hypothetical protein